MTDEAMRRKIEGGLYLVVDPAPGLEKILPKIEAALEGGVDVIQLWDHWDPVRSQEKFVVSVCDLAHRYQVPVLINNRWRWLETSPLDGVHFDDIPEDLNQIREQVGRPFLVGITCGNDRARISWAIDTKADYISFCSMFPSATSISCELVRHDVVKAVRALTRMPIFVSGGITFDNLPSLMALGISGVAIVSGIMKSEDPKLAAGKYKQFFSKTPDKF